MSQHGIGLHWRKDLTDAERVNELEVALRMIWRLAVDAHRPYHEERPEIPTEYFNIATVAACALRSGPEEPRP